MRFYTHRHKYYCGIDLHTSVMYVCLTDEAGNVLVHKNLRTTPEALIRVIEPYREDLAIAVECVFVWYWIADLCTRLGVTFVLGHALYMRSGMLPEAYAYPREMRSTRDLLRRRSYLVRKHTELLGHVQNTRHQYNMPAFEKRIDRACNRSGLPDRFDDPMVAASIEIDTRVLDVLQQQIHFVEVRITQQARCHDPTAVPLLRTIPGIGITLALTILYEIGDISRFPRVGNFISYARLVKSAHESASKRSSGRNNKIGNAHLRWAFGEAACLFLRYSEPAKAWHQKLVSKYGKAKALSIIAQRLGRTVYTILKRRTAFDQSRFFESLN